MIAAFQKHDADAIGMSGLLVKSTVIMKEDLLTLNERGLAPPVILGGAALNRRYVEEDLRTLYRGQLFYGEDAFAGLRIMDELGGPQAAASGVGSAGPDAASPTGPTALRREVVRTTNDATCCPTHAADAPQDGQRPAVADAAAGPGRARSRRSWAAGS